MACATRSIRGRGCKFYATIAVHIFGLVWVRPPPLYQSEHESAMVSLNRILDTLQADWPLLGSFALASSAEIPAWVARSAERVHTGLSPMERIFCQHQLPRLIAQLAFLRRNWTVTVLLAIFLALAVVAYAEPMVHDSVRMGILVTVLSSILLPPMVIYHGIARDYVAAQSLLAAIRTPIR
jgi:hypothetical protein